MTNTTSTLKRLDAGQYFLTLASGRTLYLEKDEQSFCYGRSVEWVAYDESSGQRVRVRSHDTLKSLRAFCEMADASPAS